MAKLIVSSCYIKSSTHFLNYLEYAGEKLEAQSVTLQNGETLPFSPNEMISLSDTVKSVNISFKDGHNKSISPERYKLLTEQKTHSFDATDLYDTDDKIKKEFINPATYIDYIATRPSVEKISGEGHGLFGLSGASDIVEQKNLAEQYRKNIKWSHIVSMKREDAQRTGYDNRAAWEALIRAKAPAIAKQYNISMENLILNCAYHDKDNHPHIHLFIYSKDSREAFVKGGKEALIKSSQKVKSLLFNEIFKDDVSYLKEQKNEREHTMEARLKELSATIAHKSHVPPAILISKTEALAQKLHGEKGRKFYGYLAPALKQEVNNVLRCAIEQDTVLSEAFDEYMKTYRLFVEQYIDEPQKVEERMHQIRECLLSPQSKGDSTVLQNIIIKGVLQYNEAIKDKTVSKKEDNNEKASIFEAAENIEKNKIVSEYYANNKIIRLPHQEQNRQHQEEVRHRQEQNQLSQNKAKPQRLLYSCVKSMLYGLCSSFAQSAEDTTSTMGHRNRKRRNINLCKSKLDSSPHEERGRQQSEVHSPTQF